MFQAFDTRDCSGPTIHDGPLEAGKCFPVANATYSFRAGLPSHCVLIAYKDKNCGDIDGDGNSDRDDDGNGQELFRAALQKPVIVEDSNDGDDEGDGDGEQAEYIEDDQDEDTLKLTDKCFVAQVLEEVPGEPETTLAKDATLWSAKVVCLGKSTIIPVRKD